MRGRAQVPSAKGEQGHPSGLWYPDRGISRHEEPRSYLDAYSYSDEDDRDALGSVIQATTP